MEVFGYPVWWAVRCEALHFALGFLVAWLLSWWILTMFGTAAAGIRRPLFWLVSSVSVLVHVWQDYTLNWF